MFFLFWTILNLFVLYKAARYLGKKIGVVGAIFILLFLYSFSAEKSHQPRRESRQWVSPFYAENVSSKKSMYSYVIKDHLLFKVHLIVTYTEGTDGKILPLSAVVSRDGMFSGYDWKATLVLLNDVELPNQFSYSIHREITGSLLGIQIFQDERELKGFITLPGSGF